MTVRIAAITVALTACLSVCADDGWIPMRIQGRVPFVKARLNDGREHPFIVDSGATATVITPPTAKEAGVKIWPQPSSYGKCSLKSLSVGTAVARDFVALVFDPPQAQPLRLNHGIDYRGLLGYTFLANYAATIDYPGGRIRFDTHADKPPKAPHVVPFMLKDKLIHVRGGINGKGPVTFLLDTGSAELLIHPRTAARLKLPTTWPDRPEAARFARLSSVTLAGATVSNIVAVVHVPPTERYYNASYDAILGYPFLSNFAVTLDYRHRRVALSPGIPNAGPDK